MRTPAGLRASNRCDYDQQNHRSGGQGCEPHRLQRSEVERNHYFASQRWVLLSAREAPRLAPRIGGFRRGWHFEVALKYRGVVSSAALFWQLPCPGPCASPAVA